ncbi:MAG: hypothetical protein ABI276_05140 [Acidimicrobiales bacterium]
MKGSIERKLRRNSEALHRAREALEVAEAQLSHFAAAADDAERDAIVADTPMRSAEHRGAARAADVMRRDRDRLSAEIDQLERTQDELLDRLTAGG